MLFSAFNRAEEVEFLFDDRTAQSRSELLRAIRQRAKVVLLCERIIAQKIEPVSVEVVGTGLGDDVDDSRRRAAKFRGIRVGHDLKFLNRFLCDSRTRGL